MGKNQISKDKVKAVLFDMDGTLTDTERIYQRCWLRATEELGYDFFKQEDALLLRSLYHEYAKKLLDEMYPGLIDFDEMHKRCAELFEEEMAGKDIPLKPYAKEIIEYLKGQGYTVAVVTATKYNNAIRRLTLCGLIDEFELIISAHDCERGKPFGDPYEYAARQIGLDTCDCVAVEDSPNGVRSAYAAGCQTIMVPDLTKADQEMKEKCVAIFDTLEGLEEVL